MLVNASLRNLIFHEFCVNTVIVVSVLRYMLTAIVSRTTVPTTAFVPHYVFPSRSELSPAFGPLPLAVLPDTSHIVSALERNLCGELPGDYGKHTLVG